MPRSAYPGLQPRPIEYGHTKIALVQPVKDMVSRGGGFARKLILLLAGGAGFGAGIMHGLRKSQERSLAEEVSKQQMYGNLSRMGGGF